MVGHQMPAAFAAILPLAELALLEHADMLGAGRDAHGLRFPEAAGVDGAARPGAAGCAVTITHGFRRTGCLDLDRAAGAFARQFHQGILALQSADRDHPIDRMSWTAATIPRPHATQRPRCVRQFTLSSDRRTPGFSRSANRQRNSAGWKTWLHF